MADGLRPIAPSLAGYRRDWLVGDVSAGLAVAAVALPIAIAYPAIAGLPPETGFYASIAPLVAYALFGPSRQLMVGPDAATMTLLAAVLGAALATLPPEAEADRVALAGALAVAVGVMCLIARALRLGVVATFLSRPILVGFFAGIALSLLVGQIGRFTGLRIESQGLMRPLMELAGKAAQIHLPSLALGVAMLAILQAVQWLRLRLPGPVIVVALSAALSAALDFEGLGIAVVGEVSLAAPHLILPDRGDLPLELLLLGAAAVFLISFGSGIVTSRSFATRAGDDVDANRELIGFGAANVAAGFFGGFPISGASSRTAIAVATGGRTQVAGLVAAAALTLSILFLGDVLRVLPMPALGAIIVSAALGMIDVAALRQVWRVSPVEFAIAAIAMAGPIVLGVLTGVIVAIVATLAYLLWRLTTPRDALLGRIPGREGFHKLHRRPEARPVLGLTLALVQGSLLFFNADHVKARLRAIAAASPPGTRALILDASAIAQIDGTGAAMLDELAAELATRGMALGIAELHAEARALLERAGVIDRIGADMVFDDLDDAVRALVGPEGGAMTRTRDGAPPAPGREVTT